MKGSQRVLIATLLVAIGCDNANRATHRPADHAGSDKVAKAGAAAQQEATPRTLAAELEEAYRTKSADRLAAFFRRWHDSVRPANLETIKDPVEREVYALYRSFFSPFALDKIAGRPIAQPSYKGVQYVLVQTSLEFRVGRVDPEQWRTLADFRPPVQFPNAEVLYLTPTYEKALVTFLEVSNTRETSKAQGDEALRRLEFLAPFVQVTIGHWSGWDLLTAPSVLDVELTEDLTEADVAFALIWEGGKTVMRRGPDGWKIEKSGVQWMQ